MSATTDQSAPDPVPIEYSDLPVLFQTADRFSVGRQQYFLFLVRCRFAALVLAAVGGVATVRVADLEWAALATAVFLLLALAVEIIIRVAGPEVDWYDGRLLAESVKSLAWRYAVGAHPFPVVDEQSGISDRDEHERAMRQEFLSELQHMLADIPNIGIPPPHGSEISERFQRLRGSSLSVRRVTYTKYRIIDQENWYRNKSQMNRRNQTRLWAVIVLVEALALVLASLRFADVVRADLAGVAVAVAAVATGWVAVRQYAALARAYVVAAHDLVIVRDRLEVSLDENVWAAEAADAEESISREHTLWRASRSSGFNRLHRAPSE